MKNIIFIEGDYQYNVVSIFQEYMINAYRKMGYDTKMIYVDIDNADKFVRDLYDTVDEKTEFIFLFNLIGIEVLNELAKSIDFFRVKRVGFIVDSTLVHYYRIKHLKKDDVLFCIDQNHINIGKLYCDNVFFCPHGGCVSSVEVPVHSKERTRDVIFAGTFREPESIKDSWMDKYDKGIRKVIDDLINYVTAAKTLYLENIVEKTIFSKDDFEEMMDSGYYQIFLDVDTYLRVSKRKKIIETLLETGIEVECYGNGWETLELQNIKVNKAISFTDTLNIMQHSKVILNCSPSYKKGAHERIFSSMLSGAISLTDRNEFLMEQFEGNSNVLFYDYDNLFRDALNLKSILRNDDMRIDIALKGQKIAKEQHTWYNRAEYILNKIKEIN